MPNQKIKAGFIEPMLLLRTETLGAGGIWMYELKLDGYRAIAYKSGSEVQLRSRNDNDFNGRYPGILNALSGMPNETVIDGEIVALDEAGRASFNILQNYGSSKAPILYYVFDVMVLAGREVMHEGLVRRRELLQERVLPKLDDQVRFSQELDASLTDLIRSVKEQGLEGLVAKRRDSI